MTRAEAIAALRAGQEAGPLSPQGALAGVLAGCPASVGPSDAGDGAVSDVTVAPDATLATPRDIAAFSTSLLIRGLGR